MLCVALATCFRVCGIYCTQYTYGLHGLRKGDEHPAYTPLKSVAPFTCTFYVGKFLLYVTVPACMTLKEQGRVQLKPNSITLVGSELVQSWFGAGSKLDRAEIWPII